MYKSRLVIYFLPPHLSLPPLPPPRHALPDGAPAPPAGSSSCTIVYRYSLLPPSFPRSSFCAARDFVTAARHSFCLPARMLCFVRTCVIFPPLLYAPIHQPQNHVSAVQWQWARASALAMSRARNIFSTCSGTSRIFFIHLKTVNC